MVRLENVGLRYGHGPEILKDVSFRLEPGEFRFLTGPSGAGKSSLLRLLFLALQPTRGLINLFGQDVTTVKRGANCRRCDAASAWCSRISACSTI